MVDIFALFRRLPLAVFPLCIICGLYLFVKEFKRTPTLDTRSAMSAKYPGKVLKTRAREMYMQLLATTLTGTVYRSRSMGFKAGPAKGLPRLAYNNATRSEGNDWPEIGMTMVGMKGLANIRQALETVIRGKVAGDFLEAGVWRGGASIFAKGVLRVYGEDVKRRVWVCDSFRGLPENSTKLDSPHWKTLKVLEVSKDSVREHFKQFDLLDDNVLFRKGYFVDSLPKVRKEIGSLAVLRADGDMYESTMDIVFNLYDKLSRDGFIIIDDYGIPECKRAILDFRRMHKITEPIIGFTKYNLKVFWVKRNRVILNSKWYNNFLTERKLKKS